MKPLKSLPDHNLWKEHFFLESPEQVSVFRRKLLNARLISETSALGELVEIYADNYTHRNFERALMYLEHRCPTWPEMVELKEFLWEPHDIVFQVHPRKEEYININKTALHLWKPKDVQSLRTLQSVRTLVEQTMFMLMREPIPSDLFFEKRYFAAKDFVAIFGGKDWPTWEEVCFIKKHCFGDYRTALQFNISRKVDLNSRHILILWDADDFNIPLPPKEYV